LNLPQKSLKNGKGRFSPDKSGTGFSKVRLSLSKEIQFGGSVESADAVTDVAYRFIKV